MLAAASGQAQEGPVDPATGEIDGRVALSFWPFSGETPSGRLPAEEFEVHLAPASDQDRVLIYPCGEWFQPPPGKYKLWLEGDGWMSPHSTVMHFAGGRFTGRGGVIESQVVPAGDITLGDTLDFGSLGILRLLHLDSHKMGGVLKKEISRRVAGDARLKPVRMPAGQVVAALYDNQEETYQKLSRPFLVPERGSATPVFVDPLEGSAHLVAMLERASPAPELGGEDTIPVVSNAEGQTTHPDVLVPTAERIYAIWYNLGDSYVNLRVESSKERLPQQEIILAPGRIASFRGALQRLPKLDIGIELPEEISGTEFNLLISRMDTWLQVDKTQLKPDEVHHTFMDLPADPLWVTLELEPWRFYQKVDLSDGQDAEIVIRPEAINLQGTVYHGDAEAAATVIFGTDRRDPAQELRVQTDPDGHYKTTLYRSGYYWISVDLDGTSQAPFIHSATEEIMEDRRLDFHVPAGEHTVRVVDAETGEGIAQAEVFANNKFGEPQRIVSKSSRSDSEGMATLMALRPGLVTVSARAEGYFPSDELTADVSEGSPNLEFTLELEPADLAEAIRLLLPDGRPASGAEVRLLPTLDTLFPIWEGRAGADGEVKIPRRAEDEWYLLGRHPESASFVKPVFAALNERVLQLKPRTAALTVRVVNRSGEIVGGAPIALFTEDTWLRGQALAWLTGSPVAGTHSGGIWVAERLAPGTIRLLSWSRDITASYQAGALDSLATQVSSPWDGRVIELVRVE